MADPCAIPGATPGATLTDGLAPTPGPTGLFRALLRTDQPESTKRALALMSGGTLCFCLTVLTLAVWYQALLRGAVDGALVTCLLGVGAWTAGLAGVAYRKEDPK